MIVEILNASVPLWLLIGIAGGHAAVAISFMRRALKAELRVYELEHAQFVAKALQR